MECFHYQYESLWRQLQTTLLVPGYSLQRDSVKKLFLIRPDIFRGIRLLILVQCLQSLMSDYPNAMDTGSMESATPAITHMTQQVSRKNPDYGHLG